MHHLGWIRIATRVASLFVVLLGGCDSAPGVDGPDGSPPVITGFSFSPAFVDLATLPPDQQTDTTAVIPFSIQVRASDDDGDLQAVEYLVQALVAGQPPLLQGSMSGSGAQFSADANLTVPLGAIANYSVLVYAVDANGQISNRSRGLVRVTSSSEGGPPVIESV